jgi:uncharacterized protein
MRFEWDENKNRLNLLKHDVSFETASLVFDDIHARTLKDPFSEEEERWVTLGRIGVSTILFVVHTSRQGDEENEVVRIISARTATPRERRSYEEAYQTAKARNLRSRREKGRRY